MSGNQEKMQLNRSASGFTVASPGSVLTAARIRPSPDTLQSVISASEERGNILIAMRNGISQSQAAAQFKRDRDLNSFRDSFKDAIQTYTFDAAFSGFQAQESVYTPYFSSATQSVLAGQNATFLIYGPSGAGKSFNFNGEGKGIVFKTCEDILKQISPHLFGGASNSRLNTNQSNPPNQMRPSSSSKQRIGSQTSMQSAGSSSSATATSSGVVKVSMYAIFADEIFDLLQPFLSNNLKASVREIEEKSNSEVKIPSLIRKDVRMMAELNVAISNAISNLLLIGEELKEPNFYGKCHLVTQFEVPQSSKSSKLSIVRLADTDIYENSQESAKNDFAVLKKFINHCSKQTPSATSPVSASSSSKIYKQAKLTYTLRSTLNENSHIRLLCCVSAAPVAFIPTIKAIEFFGRLSTGQQQHPNNQILDRPSSASVSQKSLQRMPSAISDGSRHSTDQNQPAGSRFTTKAGSNQLNSSYQKQQQEQPIQHRNSQKQSTAPATRTQSDFDPESLVLEAENLIKELSRWTPSQLAKMSKIDRNAWVAEKHDEIRSIQRQFENLHESLPQNQVIYINSLIKNAQSTLNKAYQAKQSDYATATSSSEDEVDEIKEKIDRQIDHLQSSNSQWNKSQQQQHYQNPSSTSFNQQGYRSDGSAHYPRRVPTVSSENAAARSQVIEQLQDRLRDSQIRAEDMLQEQRAALEEESRENLRHVEREYLAQSQRQFYQLNSEFDDQLRSKEQTIERLSQGVRNNADDLSNAIRRIRELELELDNAQRLEAYLRDSQLTMNQKVLKKRNKIKELKLENQSLQATIHNDHERVDEEVNKLESALSKAHITISQMRGQLHDFETDLKQSCRKNEDIQYELECAAREKSAILEEKREVQEKLQQQFDENIDRTRQMNKQLEELDNSRKFIVDLEDKLSVTREKLETERQQAASKLQTHRNKRKDELTQLNAYIDEQEARIVQLEADLKDQTAQTVQVTQVQSATQEDKIQLECDLQKALASAADANTALHNSKLATERMENLIASLEDRIKQIEAVSLEDARLVQQLRGELEDAISANQELSYANNELENKIVTIEDAQNQEITNIERQVDALIDEITVTKSANEEQKLKEESLRKQIITLTDEVEAIKEKYYKSKHSNKILKAEIKAHEEHFRTLETQQLLNEKEQEKLLMTQKISKQKETKMKVIDEIQSLIQSHKKIQYSTPSRR